jgi:hypothetical protein
MNCIEKLAADRQEFLNSLKKNKGINLDIFDDFYPDKAHFIYELLQNAEDAGATEVHFELTPHQCNFEHDGSKHFDCNDVDAITGVNSSSKKDEVDKIGKFGVGFKAVFAYTTTPTIYSKNFSFRIKDRFLPVPIPPKSLIGERTRFEFPFDNPKKNVKTAFSEVMSGLEQLSETTLLFLNNLRYISWKIGEQEGAVLREEHSSAHVEVLKLSDGKEVLSTHWLRFSAPVQNLDKFTAPMDGVERQKVALAFELAFVGDNKSFDVKRSIAGQFKIVPAVRGKVAVFFPAEKETSGLRFHVHAPFIPELSRASIKSSPENLPLFEQLAELAAKSLHDIKTLGLLTSEFLGALPNNDDTLPERYALIRKAILDEMRAESLVPTYVGGYAPAVRLFQARASVKALLSSEDLAFLTDRNDKPEWTISANQRNQNQDKLLTSLRIPSWDAEDLKDFLESRVRVSSNYWQRAQVEPVAMKWLAHKSLEWHQALYAVLNKFCEDEEDFFNLSETKIVRMLDGTYSLPKDAYFLTGPTSAQDPLPRIDEEILAVGTKKPQQVAARKFLEKIGVKTPGELEEITLLLKSRYGPDGDDPSDDEYLADLNLLMTFAEANPQNWEMVANAILFRIDSPTYSWGRASDAYIDLPFVNTRLRTFYDSIPSETEFKKWPLSDWYKNQPIDQEKLIKFAEYAGVEREFRRLHVETNCEKNERYSFLKQAPGERFTSPKDSDFTLTRLAHDMLLKRTIEGSWLVWSAMCRLGSHVLNACYRKNESSGARYADSQLVCWLRDLAWVPQKGGDFVPPREATAAMLPDGFTVDAGYKWLEAVRFGTDAKEREVATIERDEKLKTLGISNELLLLAQLLQSLPKDAQERLLEDATQLKSDTVELPERPVRNVDLRFERVSVQANATPEKNSVIKPRSVQEGAELAKQEAKLYLKDQYTNTNGQMICQACKGELPFKLPNGSYYFEAVEIVRGSPKRFREGFLALCPNHAASYLHANAQSNSMLDVIATATGNEVELALGNIETSLYFTQTHLADAKACFESIKDDNS